MTELKPCPFCGNDINIDITHFTIPLLEDLGSWHIMCKICGVQVHCTSKKRAIEAWNRRAEPSKKQTLMQAYNEGSDT